VHDESSWQKLFLEIAIALYLTYWEVIAMKEYNTIREAVGVFDNYDSMHQAVNDLEINGFERRQISVLGSQKALEESFGSKDVKTELLADNPNVPRGTDIKKEELGIGQGVLVSGGIVVGVVGSILLSGGIAAPGLVTTMIAGGMGGTVVGGVLAKLLGDKYAEFFGRQIANGGLLLWVQTPSIDDELRAQKILDKNGAHNVHIHTVPVAPLSEKTKSVLLGKAFVKLDHIMEHNEHILCSDNMLSDRLKQVRESIKESANNCRPISQTEVVSMLENVAQAAIQARDMAEEEQRFVEESMSFRIPQKNHHDSEKYFSLANDLRSFVGEYESVVL